MKMTSRLLAGLAGLLALIVASTIWCPLMELLVGPNGLLTNALALPPSADEAGEADNSGMVTMGMAASNHDATAGALDVRAAGEAGAYVGATARTRGRRLGMLLWRRDQNHNHNHNHNPAGKSSAIQGGLRARVGMLLWADGRSATDTFAHSLLATGEMRYCNGLKESFKRDHPPLTDTALKVCLSILGSYLLQYPYAWLDRSRAETEQTVRAASASSLAGGIEALLASALAQVTPSKPARAQPTPLSPLPSSLLAPRPSPLTEVCHAKGVPGAHQARAPHQPYEPA